MHEVVCIQNWNMHRLTVDKIKVFAFMDLDLHLHSLIMQDLKYSRKNISKK